MTIRPPVLTALGLALALGFALSCGDSAATDEAVAPSRLSKDGATTNFREELDGGRVGFDMVRIEAAQGWIGRTEVTWDEYLLFCDFEADDLPEGLDAEAKPSKPLEVHPYDRDWGAGPRPAVGMSWNAAKLYCDWLSEKTGRRYRLPTRKEWELACGPADQATRKARAWTAADARGKTEPVATKDPNALGVHDMLGNLAEYFAASDGVSAPDPVELLGGSWRDDLAAVHPKARLEFNEDWTLDDPGFPPGKWWIPDGEFIGFRVFCEASN